MPKSSIPYKPPNEFTLGIEDSIQFKSGRNVAPQNYPGNTNQKSIDMKPSR